MTLLRLEALCSRFDSIGAVVSGGSSGVGLARTQRRISRRMYFAVEDGRLLFERLTAPSSALRRHRDRLRVRFGAAPSSPTFSTWRRFRPSSTSRARPSRLAGRPTATSTSADLEATRRRRTSASSSSVAASPLARVVVVGASLAGPQAVRRGCARMLDTAAAAASAARCVQMP